MMFPYENNDYNNSPTMNIIIISPVMYIYSHPPKKIEQELYTIPSGYIATVSRILRFNLLEPRYVGRQALLQHRQGDQPLTSLATFFDCRCFLK